MTSKNRNMITVVVLAITIFTTTGILVSTLQQVEQIQMSHIIQLDEARPELGIFRNTPKESKERVTGTSSAEYGTDLG